MSTATVLEGNTFQRMVELRRTLHEHPELAFQEVQTAEVIMAELDRLGIDYEYGGKGGAVIGRLEGKDRSAPTVALRAEMDALPVHERTGLPFASKVSGRMHACGHDVHMATVLGAAAHHVQDPPPGNVVYVFQPAEERGGGARVVLESGALEGVDAIFAGHVTYHYRVGEIMVSRGTVTAQSDGFGIQIKGKGGHGARPHEAIDAVVIAGMLITSIQTLVSRETDPVHPSVVTIGKVVAGSAPNVIAEEAMLEGTIRTTLPAVRKHLHQGIERLGRAAADLYRADVDVVIRGGYPPVVNSDREVDIAREAVRLMGGEARVVEQEYPSMGAEDFGFFCKQIPSCYVRYGVRTETDDYIPLHSPLFDVDERVLEIGAAFLDRVARVAIARLA
ncbi:MAG: peptidase M20 [Gemmatimonas sp. SG8_23]|nr:MAG: peptidase M20 [Gemmatimonas sp. SG8_23]